MGDKLWLITMQLLVAIKNKTYDISRFNRHALNRDIEITSDVYLSPTLTCHPIQRSWISFHTLLTLYDNQRSNKSLRGRLTSVSGWLSRAIVLGPQYREIVENDSFTYTFVQWWYLFLFVEKPRCEISAKYSRVFVVALVQRSGKLLNLAKNAWKSPRITPHGVKEFAITKRKCTARTLINASHLAYHYSDWNEKN